MWPVALSGRLPVVALVGLYPTNKLIGREPIPNRKTFHIQTMRPDVICGIRPSFPGLSRSQGQVTHVLLTRSPLIRLVQAPDFIVRLACVKHAASVRPEPGSNSPKIYMFSDRSITWPRNQQAAKKATLLRSQQINNWHHQKQTNTLLSSQRTDTQTDPTSHNNSQPSPKGALHIFTIMRPPDIHAPFPLRFLPANEL